MPVYSLIGVVRLRGMRSTPNLVKAVARIVLDKGGVVCSCENWGIQPFAQPTRRMKQWHYDGHWFHLSFACNPETLQHVQDSFKFSEDMVRFTVLHRGDTSHAQFGFQEGLIPPEAPGLVLSDEERSAILSKLASDAGVRTEASTVVQQAQQQAAKSDAVFSEWKE